MLYMDSVSEIMVVVDDDDDDDDDEGLLTSCTSSLTACTCKKWDFSGALEQFDQMPLHIIAPPATRTVYAL